MECGGRLASTVRTAATSAWPITWPPNTRCQPTCGERPRNRLTSSGSRSRSVEQILNGGGGGGHESRFRYGLPPLTPGRGAKSRRGARAPARCCGAKIVRAAVSLPPVPHIRCRRSQHRVQIRCRDDCREYDAQPDKGLGHVLLGMVLGLGCHGIRPFLLGGDRRTETSRSLAAPRRIRLSSNTAAKF